MKFAIALLFPLSIVLGAWDNAWVYPVTSFQCCRWAIAFLLISQTEKWANRNRSVIDLTAIGLYFGQISEHSGLDGVQDNFFWNRP